MDEHTDQEPRLDGETDPACPHGCRNGKPMSWVEDQWYCPGCGDEWVADPPFNKVGA